jgi:hypothetical protein
MTHRLPDYVPGQEISASRLTATQREALRGRMSASFGPGLSSVNSMAGSQSSHFERPQVQMCIAIEDFAPFQATDLYTTDPVPSGPSILYRLNARTGNYESEEENLPFRVWDVMSEVVGKPTEIKKGTVFYAALNKESQRLEIIASTGMQVLEGLNVGCVGDGWYRIELADFDDTPAADYYYCSEDMQQELQDDCDLCEETRPEDLDAYTGTCAPLGGVMMNRTRPIGRGEFVYAHDARRLPILEGGHVRLLPIHYCAKSVPAPDSTPEEPKWMEVKEQYYAIMSAEYELLQIPLSDWECCDGEVIQTKCDWLIIEGKHCEGWEVTCPQ